LEDGFAGFDAGHEFGAVGFGEGVRGREHAARGDDQGEEFLNEDKRRLHGPGDKHDMAELESAEWRGVFRGLIEAAGRKFVLIPAEVVAEFVEVGKADFVAEDAAV